MRSVSLTVGHYWWPSGRWLAGATTRELIENGLARAARDRLHVIMGTVGTELVRGLAATTTISIIDAPVSGSMSMAETAAITTMIGATPEQFERVRPLLAG